MASEIRTRRAPGSGAPPLDEKHPARTADEEPVWRTDHEATATAG
jgi:hypothetical protein